MRIDLIGGALAVAVFFSPIVARADQRAADLKRLNLDPRVAAKLPKRCVYKVKSYQFFISDPPCMKLFPLRRLRGVWYVGMEASNFFPGATAVPLEAQLNTSTIWLDAEDSGDPRVRRIMSDGHGIYAIDMLAHVPPLEGAYGHFGMFKRGVLLQRVLSIKVLTRNALPPARSYRKAAPSR